MVAVEHDGNARGYAVAAARAQPSEPGVSPAGLSTEEAAARALQHARENTERWDEEDREWDRRGATSPSAWDDEDQED